MKLVLITGGCGFIGSHLAAAWLAEGCAVRVVDDMSTGRESNLAGLGGDLQVIRGSVTDAGTVRRAVRGVDAVFHHAALPSVQRSVEEPELAHEINALGTLNVLEACRRGGVQRIVYASTSAVYGDRPEPAMHEELAPGPKSPYAATKAAGELLMRSYAGCYGLDTVCLRYFNVYGPRQDPTSEYSAVIPRFIAKALKGEPPVIYGDGKQTRDFIYIGDVVRANILAATVKGAAGAVVNIATGKATSLLDLLASLGEVFGRGLAARMERARAGDIRDSCAVVEAAADRLDFRAQVGLAEGLRRTAEWMAAQNE